jgi:hypothetical protein
LAIYICDDKLINLRMELVENGMAAAAEWILTYFRVPPGHPTFLASWYKNYVESLCRPPKMQSVPDVTVSLPEFFRNVLLTYLVSRSLQTIVLKSLQATICLKMVLTYNTAIRQHSPPNYSFGSFFRRSLPHLFFTQLHDTLVSSNEAIHVHLQCRWYHFLSFVKR